MKIISNYSIGNTFHKTNFCSNYPQNNEDNYEKINTDSELFNSIRDIYSKKDPDVNILNCIDDNDTFTVNCEISDIPYKFNDYYPEINIPKQDINDRHKNLINMIDNLKKTTMGTFIRDGNKEVFIPYILGRTPDIKRDEVLVMNGNIPNDHYDNFDEIREELENILDRYIENDEITTINYLSKTKEGFDNNEVKQAYGYYDKDDSVTYLYIPEKNKIQTLFENGYVKSYHLE